MYAIKNDTYMPRNIFQNNSPASRLIPILTLKALYSTCCRPALSSPKVVSYALIPVTISKLSIFQPLRVNLGSKCFPTVSVTKTSDRESNCEFSSDKRNFCRSNGKLAIFHESFITHCSFISRYMRSPDVSMVEKDL